MAATETDPRQHAAEKFCYLTTTGRVSGKAHEIEIWFAFPPEAAGNRLYMLAGSGFRADWVRNIQHNPAVTIRIGGDEYAANGAIIAPTDDDDRLARELLCGKYQDWQPGQPFSDWGNTAQPVRFILA